MKTAAAGLGLCLALLAGMSSRGADAPAPRTLPLWPAAAPGEAGAIPPESSEVERGVRRVSNVSAPVLTVFRPEAGKNNGAAVVILPGGGYRILADDHEGDQVAKYLADLGVTGIVVKYRVPRRAGTPDDVPPPQALMDAQRAIGLVRAHAGEWGIDPKRVGILGFSAGGHLAAWATAAPGDQRTYDPVDAADKLGARPDFTVLIYPAYLVKRGTDAVSPEVEVSSATPPTFLAMAGDDAITVGGSLAYVGALRKAKVPFELHVYDGGGHGFGMNATGRPAAAWPDRLADWMRIRGLLKPTTTP